MSTEPAYRWSGYLAASSVSSGVTVRANAATLIPAVSRSVTIARPRPREPPETSTTDAGGTDSDIAFQRLLLRDLVQEPDPPRYAVVRQAAGAPQHQVGVGDRTERVVDHDLGGDHAADQWGLA